MKIEEYLEYIKKDYDKTEATQHLKKEGWHELEKRIDLISGKPVRPRWFPYAVAFASVAIFIGGMFAAYSVAQAALPGDALYPVKLLSEKLIQKTSGSNQVIIDNRADEIVGLSKKVEVNQSELKKVVIEYTQYVQQTQEQIQQSGTSNSEFKKKLDEQHSEFDKVSHDHPDIQKEIKDAQEVSDHNQDTPQNSDGSH